MDFVLSIGQGSYIDSPFAADNWVDSKLAVNYNESIFCGLRYTPLNTYSFKSIAESTLAKIEDLTDNWDGEGAIKPLRESINNAKMLADLIVPFISAPIKTTFDIYPSTYGTILFDIAYKEKELTIEMGKTRITFFNNGSNTIEEEGALFDNAISRKLDDALSWLYNGLR